MTEFKFDYKIIGPQEYEDGRKLSQNSIRGTINIDANNLDEAKKKAKPLIKNSNKYKNFSDKISSDRPRNPSIRLEESKTRLKKLEKKINRIRGVGGSSGDSPVREINEKLLIKDKKYGQTDLL